MNTFLADQSTIFQVDVWGQGGSPSVFPIRNLWDAVVNQGIVGNLIMFGFVLALGYLIWSGINYIMSGGQDDKIKKAKSGIVASIVGLIVVILAWSIIGTVRTIVNFMALA